MPWPRVPLGDLAEISAGNSAPQAESLFEGGTYPFFRTSDVGRLGFGEISSSVDLLNEAGIAKLRRFQAGTILFPKSGASTFLNHRVVMAVDGYVSSHLATIFADERKVLRSYLHYFLSTVRAQDLIQDHAYPSLRLSEIAAIMIPVPPLGEQKRIVAILDEAFEGIRIATANAEKNRALANLMFARELELVFDDLGATAPRKTLAEVAGEFGRGKSKHRPRGDPRLYGGPYPFIQTGDVSGCDHLIEAYDQTYNEQGLAQSRLWPEGTVCISIVGAKIAETGLLTFSACFPDSIIGFVPDEGQADSGYVEYMLQAFRLELRAKGKGTARHNINLATFDSERFPFPDIPSQRAIRAKLDEIRSVRSQVSALGRQKVAAFDDLRRSILSRAFSGRLIAAKGLAA